MNGQFICLVLKLQEFVIFITIHQDKWYGFLSMTNFIMSMMMENYLVQMVEYQEQQHSPMHVWC